MHSFARKSLPRQDVAEELDYILMQNSIVTWPCNENEMYLSELRSKGVSEDIITTLSAARERLVYLGSQHATWSEHSQIGGPVHEPLPLGLLQYLYAEAIARYSWVLIDPRTIAADHLLARVRLELDAWQPSLMELKNVQSVSEALESAWACPGSSNCYARDWRAVVRSERNRHSDLISFMHALEVLCKSWAIAGNYEVPMSTGATVTCMMVDWHEVEQYRLEFKMKVIELSLSFTETSIVEAMVSAEECFRARAIQLTCSPQMIPWGRGLVQAVNEGGDVWEQIQELLVDKSESRICQPRAPPWRASPLTQVARIPKWRHPIPKWCAPNRASPQPNMCMKKGKVLGTMWSNGPASRGFCIHYNRSASGCHLPSCNLAHRCSAVLTNGESCWKEHPCICHDDNVHGETRKRIVNADTHSKVVLAGKQRRET